MSLILPGYLEDLKFVVGFEFPAGDEDALRRCAHAWRVAAASLRGTGSHAEYAAAPVTAALDGATGAAFTGVWAQVAGGGAGYVDELARACDDLASACEHAATEIEYAKYEYVAALAALAVTLAVLAAMLVAGGVSAAGAPLAVAATQLTIRTLLIRLVASVAIGAALNVALDGVAQAVQLFDGGRDAWDWGVTAHAAESGAIVGAAGVGVFGLAGRFAPGIVGSRLGAAATAGVAGVAGTLAVTAVDGDLPTGAPLATSLIAGALSGAPELLRGGHPGPPGTAIHQPDLPAVSTEDGLRGIGTWTGFADDVNPAGPTDVVSGPLLDPSTNPYPVNPDPTVLHSTVPHSAVPLADHSADRAAIATADRPVTGTSIADRPDEPLVSAGGRVDPAMSDRERQAPGGGRAAPADSTGPTVGPAGPGVDEPGAHDRRPDTGRPGAHWSDPERSTTGDAGAFRDGVRGGHPGRSADLGGPTPAGEPREPHAVSGENRAADSAHRTGLDGGDRANPPRPDADAPTAIGAAAVVGYGAGRPEWGPAHRAPSADTVGRVPSADTVGRAVSVDTAGGAPSADTAGDAPSADTAGGAPPVGTDGRAPGGDRGPAAPMQAADPPSTPGARPDAGAPAGGLGLGPTTTALSDDQVLAVVRRSAFPTPAGYAFYVDSDGVRSFAEAVQPTDGYVTFDLHGSRRGFSIDGHRLSAVQFGRAVRAMTADGTVTIPPGYGVKLLSCDTAHQGSASIAAGLARELGLDVIAPDQVVWTSLAGVEIVSSPVSMGGVIIPRYPPDGAWHHFGPDGAERPLDGDPGYHGPPVDGDRPLSQFTDGL